MKSVLDTAATCAVLAVCLLILGNAAMSRSASTSLPSSPGTPVPPKAGDRLETIAGIDLSQSPRTLVMAVQSTCHFCSESMAFYRELARRKSASVRLVVVAPDDEAAAKNYVASNGFTPDAVVSSDLGAIHVAGTPTLLLANASGIIERVWMGKLSAAREKEVLAALGGTN